VEKISVVMPVHNGAAFVEEAMRSVLAQSHSDFELLVIDDASDDGTRGIVERVAGNDARVVLIGRDTNGGPGVARNCGLMAARGDWVALLDADDLYETDHLETLLKVARAHQCDAVAGNVLIRSYPQEDAVMLAFPDLTEMRELRLDQLVRSGLPGHSLSYGFLKPLFRRDFIVTHNIWYAEERVGEDFLFYFDCMKSAARWLLIPHVSYIYRRRHGSLTLSSSNNYPILVAKTEQLMEEARSAGRLDLFALLEERKKHLDRQSTYVETVALLRRGRVGPAARKILVRPWIGARLVGKGAARLRRRLSVSSWGGRRIK
jgi:succinoglycan biosynthesis protein ExoO